MRAMPLLVPALMLPCWVAALSLAAGRGAIAPRVASPVTPTMVPELAALTLPQQPRSRPASMVLPTMGLTEREQARLSAMRCTDEPLIEEMGGVFLLFGMLGAKTFGPIGALLGSFHLAPGIILCESHRSSTSPVLAAGWHTWRFAARVACGCVWSGRKAARFCRESGLREACLRLDRMTHASAAVTACARMVRFVVTWPLRKIYEASEPQTS